MSEQNLNIERLKFAGGVLIVAAAALIMFPEILKVAFGLTRILIILVVAGGACLGLAVTSRRIAKLKDSQKSSATASISDSSSDQDDGGTKPFT